MIIRSLVITCLIGGFLLALYAATGQTGAVALNWQGWQVETSPVFVGIVLALLALAAFLVGLFVEWLRGMPHRWRLKHEHKKEKQGWQATVAGFAAMAAGNYDEARKLAAKSRHFLPDKRLGAYITAEVALRDNKNFLAKEQYKELEQDPHTAILGARGLVQQAVRAGQWADVIEHCDKALEQVPNAPWFRRQLFEALLHTHQWGRAQALWGQVKNMYADAGEPCHGPALCLVRAHVEVEKDAKQAHKILKDGLKTWPDFLPLAQLRTDLLCREEKTHEATKVLEHTFESAPCPHVFEAWLRLAKSEYKASRLVDRVEKLAAKAPEPLVRYLCLGAGYREVGELAKAREQLLKAVEIEPSRDTMERLASLEELIAPNSKAGYVWWRKAVYAPAPAERNDGGVAAFQAWQQDYDVHLQSFKQAAPATPAQGLPAPV